MRTIKFRAKPIGINEFVYGYYCKDFEGKAYITTTDGVDTYVVDDKTVGQLLYVSGNVEHYCGDVYKHKYYDDCLLRVYLCPELLAVIGQVYDDEGEYDRITILPSDYDAKMIKSGNIHDNPNLLTQ